MGTLAPDDEPKRIGVVDGFNVIDCQAFPGEDCVTYAAKVALPAALFPAGSLRADIDCTRESVIELLELAGLKELAELNGWPDFDTAREFYDIRISITQVGEENEWIISIKVNVLPSASYAILNVEDPGDLRVVELSESLIDATREGFNARVSTTILNIECDGAKKKAVHLVTNVDLETLRTAIAAQGLEVLESDLAPSFIGFEELFGDDVEIAPDVLAQLNRDPDEMLHDLWMASVDADIDDADEPVN